jgi:hypothetical protein
MAIIDIAARAETPRKSLRVISFFIKLLSRERYIKFKIRPQYIESTVQNAYRSNTASVCHVPITDKSLGDVGV